MSSYHRPPQPNPGLRHSSMGPQDSASTGQSRMLVARINEKKAELENLKQLRDLSGGLAAQMQALEEKLSTLSEGTEAVAAVLSNWHNVLRAINMASMKVPKAGPAEDEGNSDDSPDIPLPQTLVRIPIESHSEILQSQNATGKSSEG
ncbi:DASH complex subunit Dad2-domain-containing protein [Usnea florida]